MKKRSQLQVAMTAWSGIPSTGLLFDAGDVGLLDVVPSLVVTNVVVLVERPVEVLSVGVGLGPLLRDHRRGGLVVPPAADVGGGLGELLLGDLGVGPFVAYVEDVDRAAAPVGCADFPGDIASSDLPA